MIFLIGSILALIAVDPGQTQQPQEIEPSKKVTIEFEQKDNGPNILLILLDDVGFSDLGFTASEISTPVMNSLANNEILMINNHVSPTCSTTRAISTTTRS